MFSYIKFLSKTFNILFFLCMKISYNKTAGITVSAPKCLPQLYYRFSMQIFRMASNTQEVTGFASSSIRAFRIEKCFYVSLELFEKMRYNLVKKSRQIMWTNIYVLRKRIRYLF